MSWLIYDCLEVLDPEMAPRVLEFAKELTRKRSLENLGFDLVEMSRIIDSGEPITRDSFPEDMARAMTEIGLNPAELEDVGGVGYFLSFGIKESSVWWNQFSGNLKGLGTNGIMNEIVARFPETRFIIGDGYYRELVKGDYRERLVNYTIDVAVDNTEAYAKLAAVLEDPQSPPFFLFHLGELPVSKVDPAIEKILARVSALVPGEKLYCILVENETIEGDLYTKFGVTTDSHISWKEATGMEWHAIQRCGGDPYFGNKPDDIVFKCFFDEAFFNRVAGEIAREDAEREARRKAEWEAKRSAGEDDDDLPW